MYMSGIACQSPLGDTYACQHCSGAKLRKISETASPFIDQNTTFLLANKKSRKNIWRFRGKYVPLHSQTSNCFNSSVG